MADETAPKLTYGQRMRQKLLGGGDGTRDVKVEFEGETYLLCPPSIRQRNAVQDALVKIEFDMEKGKPKDVKTDQGEMAVRAIIACCRDPETRAPIFTMADHDALLDGEARPLFDVLADKAVDLVRPRNIEETKKNSSPPPTAESSSSSA